MFYGSTVWDPVLISAQILTIQCLFYLTLGLALWILVGPYVSGHLVLEAFFGSSLLGVHNFVGWMAILATILNSLPVSLTILFVVERAKKCLDFSATVYILHLITAWICVGFPRAVTWWVTNGLAFVFTALLSEWLCLRRELRDIPIGGLGKKRTGGHQGSELLPLNSKPTLPSNNLMGSPPPKSLYGRLKATIGGERSSPARDPIKLATEV